jgi:cell division protein FtsN
VTAPAETPAAIPEPTNEAPADPATPAPLGSGDDAAPLPIPPPPPAGSDQQGDLGSSTEKQSAETITPAASESQAAVAARGFDKPAEADVASVQPQSAPPPPAPGELEKPKAEAETIVDEAPAPVKKKVTPAKKVAEKPAARNLGAKPVVLVPPSKKARTAAARSTASNDDGVDVADAGDGGLYGSAAGEAPANASPSVPQAPKKKRTLADLFNGNSDENAVPDTPQDVAAIDVPAAKPKAVVPKKVVSTPEPETVQQQASGSAGFVVQLASFRSKTEASTEYSRLKSKHAGALGGYAPIISEAQVGGSTRYRLSVGRMDSQAQASAVCSSLFAGGERDCLVKRQ